MNIAEQIRRGNIFPNLDVQLSLGIDLSTKRYCVVLVETDFAGHAPTAPLAPPNRVAGILQNAPSAVEEAIVRIFGWSHVVYGGVVTAGDLLKAEESGPYDRLVTFALDTDGHTHAANHTFMESTLFRVTNLLNPSVGVAGLTSPTDLAAKQYRVSGGAVVEHAASTSLADLGDGWYQVTTTAINDMSVPHFLELTAVSASHIVSPAQHHWTPRLSTDGPPVGLTYRFCIGQAFQSGVADDIGMAFIRPQLF